MALPRADKEQQLKELTSIVTGIRLFNRDSGKGGEGIDDRELFKQCTFYTCTVHVLVQCTCVCTAHEHVLILSYVYNGVYLLCTQ